MRTTTFLTIIGSGSAVLPTPGGNRSYGMVIGIHWSHFIEVESVNLCWIESRCKVPISTTPSGGSSEEWQSGSEGDNISLSYATSANVLWLIAHGAGRRRKMEEMEILIPENSTDFHCKKRGSFQSILVCRIRCAWSGLVSGLLPPLSRFTPPGLKGTGLEGFLLFRYRNKGHAGHDHHQKRDQARDFGRRVFKEEGFSQRLLVQDSLSKSS